MSTTIAPPQHMSALARAQSRRLAQCGFRREVRSLPAPEAFAILADALEGGAHDDIEAMTLERFFTAPRRAGEHFVRGLFRAATVSRRDPSTRLRDLTRRERDALARELRSKGEQVGCLPYFKCYPADFLSDPAVMVMTDEELGFYWRCLLVAWLNGGIPEDRDKLAKLLRTSRRQIEKCWPAVAECWVHGSKGMLVNPRQEKERKKALARSESARASAEARWGADA